MSNLNRYFLQFLSEAPSQDILDFRTFQQQNPNDPPVQKKKRVRGTLLPRPATTVEAEQIPLGTADDLQLQPVYQGSGAVPEFGYDDSDLPQTPPPPMDRRRARLVNARQNTRELSDPNDPNFRPVVNNDHGWKGRLASLFKEFVINAGRQWDKSDPRLDPRQRLMGSLGGGIGGAAYAGFHPEVDEERQRVYDINQSRQKEVDLAAELDQQNKDFKSEQEAIARQQQLITGQPVQVVDPLTGQPVYVKGSEAYSQGQSAVRQQAGFQNQAANQKRGQDFQRIENQKTRDSNYNIALANITNSAQRENIENQIQRDRDHEANVEGYFKRKTDRLLEIAKLAGGVTGIKTMADTLTVQTRANLDRARALDDQIATEQSRGSNADRRTITSLTRERDNLMKQVDDANQKLAGEVSKAGVNTSQLEALTKAEREDRYPSPRAVPTYSPTVPQRPGESGGYSASGKIYPSPSALRSAFPGKSDQEIRQIIEAQGGKFQN